MSPGDASNPYQAPTAPPAPWTFRDGVAFRTKTLPVYWVAIASTLIVACGSLAAIGVPLLDAAVMFRVLLGTLLLHLGFIPFTTWFFQVYVCERGIRCYNIWGTYYNVEWEELTDVRPISIAGLRYIRLYSAQRGPLWLPLFLEDQPKFWRTIAAWLPATMPEPVRLALGGPGWPADKA